MPSCRTYGRRLSSNRLSRRLLSNAPRLPLAQSRPIDPQEVANLCAEYATGKSQRVPRSTFCKVSSRETFQRYRDVAGEIAHFKKEEKRSRDEKMMLCRNEASSHIKSAKALTEVSNCLDQNSETNTAEMFSDATRLLEKASDLQSLVANLEKDYNVVVVYDINEITMLSRNYIAEFVTLFPEIDSCSLFKLTEKILLSSNFTFTDLDDRDIVNISYAVENGTEYWSRVAPNYDALELLYNEISNGYKEGDPDISQELCNKCGMGETINHLRKAATQLQKKVHQRWRRVKRCLELIKKKSKSSPERYANVVLCEEGVAHGASQILASGTAHLIQLANVYSTKMWEKEEVFERLERRFGESCVFVYVSSSDTPDMRQVRHWPVEAADSIQQLYHALRKLCC